MSASTLSFLIWAGFMVVMLVGLVMASRRGNRRAKETEDVAAATLPEIGRVAERSHLVRFGSVPMDAPRMNRDKRVSWYPPAKPRTAKPG